MNFLYPLATLSFAYPQAFVFPIALLFFYIAHKSRQEGILTASVSHWTAIAPSWRMRLRKPVLGLLAILFITSLSIAAARPQRVTLASFPYEARSLVLTLDLSRSMSTEDFSSARGKMSRLEGVKTVVEQFVEARAGDRLGLVVFGGRAYLQAPLTLDHGIILDLVRRLEVGIAGDATAIGDGLGLSIKRIQSIEGTSKAVILLTDGVSNAGQVNPIKAAKVARELGIKVHTIGVGSSTTAMQAPRGFFSRRNAVAAEFDEKTLKEVAELTGGVYFNADSMEGLQKVYEEIDKLERNETEEPERRITEELFAVYATAALGFYLLYLLVARTVFLKVP